MVARAGGRVVHSDGLYRIHAISLFSLQTIKDRSIILDCQFYLLSMDDWRGFTSLNGFEKEVFIGMMKTHVADGLGQV